VHAVGAALALAGSGAAGAREPRNIIVMISDGWGYNQVTATDYYEGRSQAYEGFPVALGMSNYSANGDGYAPQRAWSEFSYRNLRPTDSAAAGTAMSTGVKTYDAAINIDMKGRRLESIVDRAEKMGKATGVVTSVEWSHATPATFVAHNASRNNYADIAMEMINHSACEVIMGAGHPWVDDNGQPVAARQYKYVGGEVTWRALLAGAAGGDADGDGRTDPWTLIQDRSQFQLLATGTTPRRVVGTAKVATTLQQARAGASDTPYAPAQNQGVPTLVEMTKAALNVLDNDPDGLFLMVEGGAVDWAGHANQSGRLIEEQSDFNRTVEAVVEWIEGHGGWDQTLLVVTGDHETGHLTGPGSGPDGAVSATVDASLWKPIVDQGRGNVPGMEWHSTNHTNQIVPFFAKGSGSELFPGRADETDPVRGRFLTNSTLGQVMLTLWPTPAGRPGLVTTGGGSSVIPATPKNVILMISDGCGYNQIAAADYYQYGREGQQVYEQFPVSIAMSTFSASGNGYAAQQAWSEFDYIKARPTDSASAGTAMATGVKTYDAAINVDMNRRRLFTITERLEQLGKASGVVTSVEWSHATPAAFVAHNVNRSNYAEIAKEMVNNSACEVIMGAGHPLYNDAGALAATPQYRYVGGDTTWRALVAGTAGADANGDGVADPWLLVQDRSQFQALASGSTPRRVLGTAKAGTTLQQARPGISSEPYAEAENPDVPTLVEMTRAALNVLDNDPDGFFVMIEGGAVDWAGHANQSGRLIEEEIGFNRTVAAVTEWVESNSNWAETLVIVTGDHETGYLTGPGSGPDGASGTAAMWKPIVNNGQGHLPGMEWHHPEHTNQLVPLFAKGAGSTRLLSYADDFDPVRGRFVTNTDVAHVLFALFGDAVAHSKEGLTVRGPNALAVDAKVIGANGPVVGATVKLEWGYRGFANYRQAQGVTDGDGLALLQLRVRSASATGLYTVSVVDSHGQVIGEWASVPLPGGHFTGLRLTLGGKAEIVDRQPLAKEFANTAAVPLATGLGGSYPNPFNPQTTLRYTLARDGHVRIAVYDVVGQEVARLMDQVQLAGVHELAWNAAGAASGTYICRMEADGQSFARRLLLVR
jgi:alkaline phosphatase